jgi:hypothetical protein
MLICAPGVFSTARIYKWPDEQKDILDSDKEALLDAIRVCRHAAIQAQTVAPIGSDVYRACDPLTNAIDNLARILTGDEAYFHLKRHTASGGV